MNKSLQRNMSNETNAQWLEVSVFYDENDTYVNGNDELPQAMLGDADDSVLDGGNRGEFLNKIRESLYYKFQLPGIKGLS